MNPFGSFWNDISINILKNRNTLYQLIFINVLVFVFVGLIEVIFTLFKLPMGIFDTFWRNLALSALQAEFIQKPWTFITYMFMHSGFMHILFNMLMFYWFGKIFQEYLRNEKLLSTYILGGIAGGLMYIFAYMTIPMLKGMQPYMVGASASVIAIIVATATLLPNTTLHLMFIGPVRLKYIAIVLVIIDVLLLKGDNTGGHFAHLGGAIYGFAYIKLMQNGIDIGHWLTQLITLFRNAFKPNPKQKFKVHRGGKTSSGNFKESAKKESQKSTAPPVKRESDQKMIDSILDKIAKSGYESLSENEKDVLFKASKK
ncbi:rhomboid family intramembrane serine protease [Bacteroidota bacterium]